MRGRSLFLGAVVAVGLAAPAGAEVLLAPQVGAAFGGSTEGSKVTYAGTLTFKGENGIVGFAIDFGYTPDFLGSSQFGSNNLTTLMGNLVLSSPGSTRFYASAGLGLIKTRVKDIDGFFDASNSEFGFNVGAGVQAFFGQSKSFGLQGDLRYFRNVTDPEPNDEFDIDLGSLSTWRATGGVVFKF